MADCRNFSLKSEDLPDDRNGEFHGFVSINVHRKSDIWSCFVEFGVVGCFNVCPLQTSPTAVPWINERCNMLLTFRGEAEPSLIFSQILSNGGQTKGKSLTKADQDRQDRIPNNSDLARLDMTNFWFCRILVLIGILWSGIGPWRYPLKYHRLNFR